MAASMDGISDEELVAALQSGEAQAFEALVRRHTDRFYAAAYRICGRAEEAEDVVQDAFLKFWRKPGGYDPARGAKFTTWFYRVVVNVAKDRMRAKKPEYGTELIDVAADDAPDQQAEMEASQEEERIERSIQALPERQRMALNLCFYEGMSNKEAAEILGVGVKALESLLMRAKAKLREELLPDADANGEKKEHCYG